MNRIRVSNWGVINPKVFLCPFYLHSRGCTTLRATPDSKPTSMPPDECHNSTSEIAWRIQKLNRSQEEDFSLNSSSFGHNKAGYRNETICVIMRPVREMRTHVMRRVEEGAELCALWVWGGGERAGGRSEAKKSLQSQTLHRWTPVVSPNDNRLLLTRYHFQIKCHYFTGPNKLLPLVFHLCHDGD